MKKLFSAVGSEVGHNRFRYAAILVVMCIWAYGCMPVKTFSPVTGEKVTRTQLDAEWDAELIRLDAELASLNLGMEAGHADIDQKIEQRRQMLAAIEPIAAGTPYGSLITGSLGALLLGVGADNVRKDRKIRKAT